jgi:hypothetical protein
LFYQIPHYEEAGIYKNITSIEECVLTECDRCRAYLIDGDTQPTCTQCIGIEDRDILEFLQGKAVFQEKVLNQFSNSLYELAHHYFTGNYQIECSSN